MIYNFKNYEIEIKYIERLFISITPTVIDINQPLMTDFLKSKQTEIKIFADSQKIKPLKKTLLESINATYQRNIDSILSQYPSAEVTGWTTKVFQSERWLSASGSDKQA